MSRAGRPKDPLNKRVFAIAVSLKESFKDHDGGFIVPQHYKHPVFVTIQEELEKLKIKKSTAAIKLFCRRNANELKQLMDLDEELVV